MTFNPPVRIFSNWPASTLVVSGDDRETFLHNLCTANVCGLQPGDAREAFFTNVKGHVLAHALIVSRTESIESIVFSRHLEPLMEHLERYIIREDVTLSASATPPILLVGAESTPDVGTWYPMLVVKESAWISTHPIDANVLGHDVAVGDDDDFVKLRVASAWPLQGVDFFEGTLPQELSRDSAAISFTKGCYLGQETVARLDALGHVNKQIVLIQGPGARERADLRDGEKVVGTVTSAAVCEEGPRGIAMVRRGSTAPGTKLESDAGEVTVVAEPLT